jgi:hypothetical protein
MHIDRRGLLRFCALPAIMALAPGTAAAQGATPAAPSQAATPVPVSLPAALAPFGLGTVSMPADREDAAALFAGLPDAILGEPLQPLQDMDDRVIAAYGLPLSGIVAPLALSAIFFADGDFFPQDFTAVDYVILASVAPDYEATDFGRDGDLVWIQAETTVGGAGEKPEAPESTTTLYTMAWGIADAPMLFTAAAIDPNGPAALAEAFVSAVESLAGS